MMKVVSWSGLTPVQKMEVLLRPKHQVERAFVGQVQAIIDCVKQKGDQALIDYAQQFDRTALSKLVVEQSQIMALSQFVDVQLKSAIDQAYQNIRCFHQVQKPQAIDVVTQLGVRCQKQYRPIQKVGLYVPGGSAPLISTALMLAVPAKLAGCEQVVLITPPNEQGNVHPAIAYIAQKCGIEQIYLSGGAQAVAAMAYGTESIPKVDKIFGPGNRWVTQAKLLVGRDANGATYDLPAGPSEVMVIADQAANPKFVAMDLLSQAEHGPDSQVMLCCLSESFAEQVRLAVEEFLQDLPRANIAIQALSYSRIIVVKDIVQAIDIANQYAPEHLILNFDQAECWVEKIKRAGSVFVGCWTPESVGDYASGTNHVLPTDGYARSVSGLGLADFMIAMSVQQVSRTGLLALADAVETLAATEGLAAHERAVSLRRQVAQQMTGERSDTDMLLPKPRADIVAMQAYSSAPVELGKNAVLSKVADVSAVYLNANENPQDVLLGQGLNRYPEPQPLALLQKFSALYDVPMENILVGRGSDEAIDVLVRSYCQAGRDAIMIAEPSYGMYEVSANIQAAQLVRVPLVRSGFTLLAQDFIDAFRANVKLVFICSPNNPVGNIMAADEVVKLCQALRGQALVVVDEAYIEFADQCSMAGDLSSQKNLVVLRTLSKAWGLAGVRCGCVLADAAVISVLQKVLAPYPLPIPVIDNILTALVPEKVAVVEKSTQSLVAERERLSLALVGLHFVRKVWPSQANFLLVEVEDVHQLMAYCLQNQIIIRDRSHLPGLANCVRVSVGSVAENDRLLEILRRKK